jgi:hypothetical protein
MLEDDLRLRFTESVQVRGLRLRINGKVYEYGLIINFKESV